MKHINHSLGQASPASFAIIGIIGAFVLIVIAVNLFEPLQTVIDNTSNSLEDNTNADTSTILLMRLLPLFLILLVVIYIFFGPNQTT